MLAEHPRPPLVSPGVRAPDDQENASGTCYGQVGSCCGASDGDSGPTGLLPGMEVKDSGAGPAAVSTPAQAPAVDLSCDCTFLTLGAVRVLGLPASEGCREGGGPALRTGPGGQRSLRGWEWFLSLRWRLGLH